MSAALYRAPLSPREVLEPRRKLRLRCACDGRRAHDQLLAACAALIFDAGCTWTPGQVDRVWAAIDRSSVTVGMLLDGWRPTP